jgi:hypothetical protein
MGESELNAMPCFAAGTKALFLQFRGGLAMSMDL